MQNIFSFQINEIEIENSKVTLFGEEKLSESYDKLFYKTFQNLFEK